MKKTIARMERTMGETAFQVGNYSFLTLMMLLFVLPFLVVLSTSLVSEAELLRRSSFILIPEKLDFGAYRVLLSQGSILYNAYGVTIARVVIGTTLNLIFTSMMAYGLSRRQLPGRSAIMMFVFVTMVFNGGLVPNYLLMKYLHLTNTFWVLVLPGLISAWNMIVMRSFFSQLPENLEESATIDGASPLRILTRVVFPLSLPTFATIGLFYGVAHWNAWFDAVIYINDVNKFPVQVLMRKIVLTMTSQDLNAELMGALTAKPTPQSLKGAMIIVTTVPIVCVYPFLQKHFVKGVLTGSIKG
ncbi:carbohydrate ABC transporter permease [Paenibacillus eucommiae]|uniref:Aldouronate transport system permease protein n=1 Tax=Paenibacillus eucommiae TaxID=1355755 RepID=A0ABS4J5S4_9BACL|nr:carbohydrate ABC transporter permease [Paenibacillus eucommiae]MBP1995160.1 putative aldouronate transport system permease protein [Paenibacillus eucommiae]